MSLKDADKMTDYSLFKATLDKLGIEYEETVGGDYKDIEINDKVTAGRASFSFISDPESEKYECHYVD